MHEYEVLIETINPCGGEAHSEKGFPGYRETESPEPYVRAEGRWTCTGHREEHGRRCRDHDRRY